MTVFRVQLFENAERVSLPHSEDNLILPPSVLDGPESRLSFLHYVKHMVGTCNCFVLHQSHDGNPRFTEEGVSAVVVAAETWCQEQPGAWEISDVNITPKKTHDAFPWSKGKLVKSQTDTIAVAVRRRKTA